MENMCVTCKGRPIATKKRGLCAPCYQQWRRKTIKTTGLLLNEDPKYGSEVAFVKNFFEHKNWFYRPIIFRVNGLRYEPDFYDGERNVFIEVAGTRQAFHNNKEKYQQFIKAFPKIKFEIRYSTGEIIPLTNIEKGIFHIPEKRK